MQILLPLRDNRGKRLPRSLFDNLVEELSEKFGGATAYSRSPAQGHWSKGARAKTEDVIIIEVMVEKANPIWWSELRHRLEEQFRQETVLLRSLKTKTY